MGITKLINSKLRIHICVEHRNIIIIIKIMYAYLRSISKRKPVEKVVIASLNSFIDLFFLYLLTFEESYLYIKLY